MVLLQLGVDARDEVAAGGRGAVFARAAGQFGGVGALGARVHGQELVFQLAELVLSVEQHPVVQDRVLSADQEVFVAVHEGRHAGVAVGVVVDCGLLEVVWPYC